MYTGNTYKINKVIKIEFYKANLTSPRSIITEEEEEMIKQITQDKKDTTIQRRLTQAHSSIFHFSWLQKSKAKFSQKIARSRRRI
jgi:hypothetical protein